MSGFSASFLAASSARCSAAPAFHAPLERGLRALTLLGLALVLLVPAARGHSQWLGWAPLWLVAMPAMAWWSLHRFRLPALAARRAWRQARPRRSGAQARRRGAPAAHLSRVA